MSGEQVIDVVLAVVTAFSLTAIVVVGGHAVLDVRRLAGTGWGLSPLGRLRVGMILVSMAVVAARVLQLIGVISEVELPPLAGLAAIAILLYAVTLMPTSAKLLPEFRARYAEASARFEALNSAPSVEAYREALMVYEGLTKDYPRSPAAHFAVASTLLMMSDHAGSRDEADGILRQARTAIDKGLALHRNEEYEDARARIDRALSGHSGQAPESPT
jgi:hypothetical protein